MKTGRLEAFSDGVLAIIITIMVLEMQVPKGATWGNLQSVAPVFLSYISSFKILKQNESKHFCFSWFLFLIL